MISDTPAGFDGQTVTCGSCGAMAEVAGADSLVALPQGWDQGHVDGALVVLCADCAIPPQFSGVSFDYPLKAGEGIL